MKKCLFTLLMICVAASFSKAQGIVYPAIQGYGGVNEVPFETIQPDPNQQYKFVVELGNRIEDKKRCLMI